MRTLASIQEVNTVEPIPNADAIERIRVLGWWIVTKKGEFRVGDRVVYCEIDSLLPERPEFEFLRPSSFKPAVVDPATGETISAGFRIKTIKLRGQVSQGICFPLSFLPAGTPLEVGTDVTETLGVRKWDPPLPVGLNGRAKGLFPGFLKKTDETRVQLLEEVLSRHEGKAFAVTEKLDGTSFTAFIREGEFGICSRNLQVDLADSESTFVRVTQSLEIETKLRAAHDRMGIDLAIQGEMIGPGIQKNKYGLPAVQLRFFNVYDISNGAFFNHHAMLHLLTELELDGVPDLGVLTLNHTVDEMVALAEGTSMLNRQVQREGIVLRPLIEQDEPVLNGRLSFKVINPKFLLKYDE